MTTTPNPSVEMRRPAPPSHGRRAAVVCDVDGALLRSSCFPYFMLVALEAGSLLRCLVLLLLHPFISLLDEEVGIRVMTFISFCGISACNFRAGTSVLPRYFLGDVGKKGFELLMTGETKICVSRMPKVMVEEFLRKYLGVEMVVAREMMVAGGYFTGFMEEKMAEEDLLGAGPDDENGALGFAAEGKASLHPLFSRCREVKMASKAEKASCRPLSKEEYPEPLIFQDGRLVFRPTPLAATAMFVWLPFGCFLAVLRAVLFIMLPYGVSTAALAFTGMKNRLVPSPFFPAADNHHEGPGRLFICNHRTQVDPLWVSGALGKRATSLVYGISSITRMLSPLRTVVLRRVKEEDRLIMAEELRRGDVILCPEGTTCREPFVLRFSPLFAELVDEVHPVALSAYGSMFHGTSVNGIKALDPFVLLANPYVYFTGEFMETVAAGPGRCSHDVANRAQAEIAGALGFRSTMLTRKDKYRYLARTDGVVPY